MRAVVLFASAVIACGAAPEQPGVDAGLDATLDAMRDAAADAVADAAADVAADAATCTTVTDAAPVVIATATTAGEQVLELVASSASDTSWGQAGNEALVLEVDRNGALLGHLILHQGRASFAYGMHAGALAAGDVLTARVSTLSAQNAVRSATVCGASLTTTASLGKLGPGVDHAPIWIWPISKRFDDVPLVVSWSAKSSGYVTFFTNENGGTTELCGGGAQGLSEEIRLWGRACDIESDYSYSANTFERCTGSASSSALRFEAAHPILYHGDGHNRAFEDRSGYDATCGTSSDAAPDGAIAGWGSPSPDPKDDSKYAIVLRPIPVPSDSLAYAFGGAPREHVLTKDAPWMFRLAGLETAREGKVDDKVTFAFDRYLHADIYVADVGGSSSSCPITGLSGGFKLRVHTTNNQTSSSGQITQASCSAQQWKHVSVPLDAVHVPSDVDQLVFDAYDNDGIYLLGVGDVYLLAKDGTNGATIASVRTGAKTLGEYVDDDSSGCTNGTSTYNNVAYPCAGGLYSFAP